MAFCASMASGLSFGSIMVLKRVACTERMSWAFFKPSFATSTKSFWVLAASEALEVPISTACLFGARPELAPTEVFAQPSMATEARRVESRGVNLLLDGWRWRGDVCNNMPIVLCEAGGNHIAQPTRKSFWRKELRRNNAFPSTASLLGQRRPNMPAS